MPDIARRAVMAAGSVHVSAVTTRAVAITRAVGKLELTLPGGMTFSDACRAHGFLLADVSHADAEAVAELPPARRDAFDRLIAATARRRGWTLVTRDRGYAELAVPTLWLD